MGIYFDKLAFLSENIENEAPLKVCDVHMGHSDLEHRDGKYQVIYSPISLYGFNISRGMCLIELATPS